MKKRSVLSLALAGLLALAAFAAGAQSPFTPGVRTLVLAHNAYPDEGKYGDRLDRALSAGLPIAIEQDLVWVNGKSLEIHNAKLATEDSPTLEAYFFPKVAPIVEKALKEGNKGNWPLITLYLDIKNDPVEHLEAINKVLDKYDAWLTKAVKTSDITKMSPLELKPMMIVLEDKQKDIKQEFFYDRVPVGGKIRAFGGPEKFDDNPNKLPRTARAERMAGLLTIDPDTLVTRHADNYHRWFGTDWSFIELCVPAHKDWTAEAEARLKEFVERGHSLGYLVGVYGINGWAESDNQGWTPEYNFGSTKDAQVRLKAALKAKVDFISTDQYEETARFIRSSR
jgi:hypothetical protein